MRSSPPTPHPRVRNRSTRPESRALVYAPNADIGRWVEAELARDDVKVQVAQSMTDLIATLGADQTLRPQFLVIDLDAVSAADLIRLHSIREQGWFGALIALGHVPPPLRSSLAIDVAVTPPFSQDQLRDAIASLRTPAQTVRVPLMRDIA